jgi:hypothetical protein
MNCETGLLGPLSRGYGIIDAPTHTSKYDSVDFFNFFSRNRPPAELIVAQTCAVAQTTRFDTGVCLFGVSLMCG